MKKIKTLLLGATMLVPAAVANAQGAAVDILCQTPGGFVACGSYNYQNITTDATTVIKTGAGVLHTITFNHPVASTTLTIFDNTTNSGATIATVTIPSNPLPVTLTYDVAFANGLTIVTGTSVSDITVSYR